MWQAIGTILLRIISDPQFDVFIGVTVVALLRAHLTGKNADRLAFLERAEKMAFGVVEDLKAKGELPAGTDKAAAALEQFNALLDAKGLTATDAEIQLAKAAWSAAHGAQKAALPASISTTTVFPAGAVK